jgi:WD40 repeat protein
MTTDKNPSFDPYHKWLAIPKTQRPPTLYQLLGLAPGESDAEVIEEAVIRQTTHVRAYQVGPHAAVCTRVLNEISKADQILRDPQKRAEYDRRLALAKAAKSAGVAKSGPAKPVAAAAESAFAGFEAGVTAAAPPRRESAKPDARQESREVKKRPSQALLIGAGAGIGVAVVAILGIVVYSMSGPAAPTRPVHSSGPLAESKTAPKSSVAKPIPTRPDVDPPQPLPVQPPVAKSPAIKAPTPAPAEPGDRPQVAEVKPPSPTAGPETPTPIAKAAPVKEPPAKAAPLPAPPVVPPPMKAPEIVQKAPQIMKGALLATYDFAGKWHAHTKDPATDVDLEIRGEGANRSLLVTVALDGKVGKAHCDRAKIGAGGKLHCPIAIDVPLPGRYVDVTEVELSDPGRDRVRVWMRAGNTSFGPPFSRVGEPMPAPVAKGEPAVAPTLKVDVPDEAKIKEGEATVRETFKSDYAKKTPSDRVALAEKLLELGSDSKDDAVARYVLDSEARAIAAAVGNWALARESIERLDAGFKIDAPALREQTLAAIVKANLSRESAVEVTDAALTEALAALAKEQLPLANRFLAAAAIAASKTASIPQISAVKKAEAEMKLVTQEAEAAAKARETLKTSPDDADANLTVGRYDALRRQDWTSSLPLLAKGGDAELAAVARKELEKPGAAAAQQKIGDDYWNLAEKEKNSAWARVALQARAVHWYRLAVPQLTGLGLTLVNERLKTLDESKLPQQTSGVAVEVRALKGHAGTVTGLLLTDGGRLLSSGLDGNLFFWDTKIGKNVGVIKSTVGPIITFSVSQSNRQIAINGKTQFHVYDVDTALPTKTGPTYMNIPVLPGSFWTEPGYVFTMGDRDYRWVTSDGGGTSGEKHNLRFHQVVPTPDGVRCVTIGNDTALFRIAKGVGKVENKGRLPVSAESTCAVFASSTSPNLLIGSVDKKITLIDTDSRNAVKTFEGSAGVPHCLAFMPEGERFLSADEGTIRIWEIATGKELAKFSCGSKTATAIAISPDGKLLFTGGNDGFVRIWTLLRDKMSADTAAAAGTP